MFDSLSFIEKINLIIACFALLISLFNLYYTRKRTNNIIAHQDKDFNYKVNKDKEDFISKFKDEIQEFRVGLLELKTTSKEIKYEDKDKYMYLVESKYSPKILKKYLGESLYKEYLGVTEVADDTLNAIILKKDYNNIYSTCQKIRYFFQRL